MPDIITATTKTGNTVKYYSDKRAEGGMKDVYFSPEKTYVVALFREKQPADALTRLEMICGRYRESIFQQAGGDYWKDFYCWPEQCLEKDGQIGVVVPFYSKKFFFDYGAKNGDSLGIKGKEKQGKWFASAKLRRKYLDPRELGDWKNYLTACLRLSRAVRRLHAAGLAHSDLSYKNVLIDPVTASVCIIDIDGLVVPGKFPPDVLGTPDFIAPEVVRTNHLKIDDPNRKLPRIETDLHALAVLIYMYLLYRHPLRGNKNHSQVTEDDERLMMGERALFIEDASDPSNRIKEPQLRKDELPWVDTTAVPYTVVGPHLSPLFERAFGSGLRNASERPTANEWETALIKTTDLIQPCANPSCEQKWYVFDNTTQPRCPFCKTRFRGSLPILNLYSSRQGSFRDDRHRVMVWTGQSLYRWHVNSLVSPNERLSDDDKKRLGYFVFHNNKWLLVNETMQDLMINDASLRADQRMVPIGGHVELADGRELLLQRGEGGRLAKIQLVIV